MDGSRAVTCHCHHRDGETEGWTFFPSGDVWVRSGHRRGTGWGVPAIPQDTAPPRDFPVFQLFPLNQESLPKPCQVPGMAVTPVSPQGKGAEQTAPQV